MQQSRKLAFTLTEVLVVMSLMALLATLATPALNFVSGSGTMSKAAVDVSGLVERCRIHAMANRTYVRLVVAQIKNDNPASVLLPLYSSDGTLEAGSTAPATASDMSDPLKWPALDKPLVLRNCLLYAGLNAETPDTSNDADLSRTLEAATFTRNIPALSRDVHSDNLTFALCIQFSPSGEAAILQSLTHVSSPSRFIKIGFDQPLSPAKLEASRGGNPFIVRLSGFNGSVTLLRKGEGL